MPLPEETEFQRQMQACAREIANGMIDHDLDIVTRHTTVVGDDNPLLILAATGERAAIIRSLLEWYFGSPDHSIDVHERTLADGSELRN